MILFLNLILIYQRVKILLVAGFAQRNVSRITISLVTTFAKAIKNRVSFFT